GIRMYSVSAGTISSVQTRSMRSRIRSTSMDTAGLYPRGVGRSGARTPPRQGPRGPIGSGVLARGGGGGPLPPRPPPPQAAPPAGPPPPRPSPPRPPPEPLPSPAAPPPDPAPAAAPEGSSPSPPFGTAVSDVPSVPGGWVPKASNGAAADGAVPGGAG